MELAKGSHILVLQPFANSRTLPSNDNGRIRGLISEIIQGEAGQNKLADNSNLLPSTSCIPWHISNKYYEADVSFRLSNVRLFSSTTQKRPTRTRRTAQMASTSDATASPDIGLDDDEELKKRVRNVFEALEKPGKSIKPKDENNTLEQDKRAELSEEMKGIDAVMMVVDSSQPLRQHQRLLAKLNSPNGEMALLSGFDLAVSIVVVLSSPLEEATSSSDQNPSMEQLNDLYTGEGWEFVDLDEQDTGSEVSFDEDGGSADSLGDEELHGIPRIREALQTHTWPNLIRKNDRFAKMQIMTDEENEVTNAEDQDHSTQEEREIERTLSLLRMDLGALDVTSEAEPTKQDEELAEAFLKRILASQTNSLPSEESVEPPLQSLASMQVELEKFLENEDTKWPLAVVDQTSTKQDEEAWSMVGSATSSSTKPAFDDDFSDFVQGSGNLSVEDESNEAASLPSPLISEAFDTELDLDDLALLRELEREQPGYSTTRNASNGISFESTLSAVMAQAERVRSINDVQKRREEAARIALTISRGQP